MAGEYVEPGFRRRTVLGAAGLAGAGLLSFGRRASAAPDAPPVEWARTYGGSGSDLGRDAVQTADGGYALVGSTGSFGGTPNDGWLVKTDPKGSVEWARTYEADGADTLRSVVDAGDGFVLAGYTRASGGDRDGWLVRTDAEGREQWSRTYAGVETDLVREAVGTTDGGFAFVGQTGHFDGSDDLWLVKTDADGRLDWEMRFGNGAFQSGYSLTPTADGGVAACGIAQPPGSAGFDAVVVKTDAAGGEEFARTFGDTMVDFGSSVVQTRDGGYAVGGRTRLSDSGTAAFWLLKLDADGREQWSRTYSGAGMDHVTAVAETAGGYALGGHSLSDDNAWLLRTDASGDLAWKKSLAGNGRERAGGVVATADGGVALLGRTKPFAGRYDFWLVKVRSVNRPPNAAFGYEPTPPVTGSPVGFDGGPSSDPDGTVARYAWDFGDGATATGKTTSHVYREGGERTVTLTVADDDGATDAARQTFTVYRWVPVDVRGDGSDRLNPSSDGVVPVTLGATATFDPAEEVATDTLRFGAPEVVAGGGGAAPVRTDTPAGELKAWFRADEMGFDGGETSANLVGETDDGVPLLGATPVTLVPGRALFGP